MRKFLLLIFFLGFTLIFITKAAAQTIADDCRDKGDPQIRADCYLAKIKDLQGQARTLSSQIAVMDSQINLTLARIEATKKQITDLNLDIDIATKKVSNLESSLDNLIKVLLNRMVATYKVGQAQPFEILLSSSDATNFFSRLNYLRVAQSHDKQLILLTQQAKNDYANQKNIFEDKKKRVTTLKTQLENYTAQLNQEKQAKSDLLAQTQGDENTFENLRRQALAQVAALANFATSQGGGILPHSDRADGFGKYYNQRDAGWGNNLIGSSTETIARVGCLLTSYAMVSTHYGTGVTPGDVGSNNSYFFSGTAYFNQPGPAPSGHSVNYIQNPSRDSLINELNAGHIIIAGLSSNGGPYPQHYSDHWVVLRSVAGNTFQINDPYYDGAMNALLTDHYSGWTIIEARIYQ